MVNTGKISFIQAASIIMLTVGLTNHVMIIPILLDEAGRDSWISVIIASLAYIPIIICIHYIIKKTGQMSIRDWLSDRFGRWATWPFLLIFIVYFVFMGAFTLKDTNTWTISSYLPGTPPRSSCHFPVCCFVPLRLIPAFRPSPSRRECFCRSSFSSVSSSCPPISSTKITVIYFLYSSMAGHRLCAGLSSCSPDLAKS